MGAGASQISASRDRWLALLNCEEFQSSGLANSWAWNIPRMRTEEHIRRLFAKAGKKSKKHIEEVKAEAERQARKLERKAAELAGEKPKGAKPVTRPRIERRGRKYQEAAKLIEKGKVSVSLRAVRT